MSGRWWKFVESISFIIAREYGRAGIELAASHELVEAHDGRVGTESVPDQTRIWFTLPECASFYRNVTVSLSARYRPGIISNPRSRFSHGLARSFV